MSIYLADQIEAFRDLPTPCLVLDHDALVRNVRGMADLATMSGPKLRPHFKTHKCVEIARLQLQHGACGIACATIAEAEQLAKHSIPNILLTGCIAGNAAIRRLVSLLPYNSMTICIDSVESVSFGLQY